MQRCGQSPPDTLFDGLFAHANQQWTIDTISSGVSMTITHASELLEESRHLLNHRYGARAELLLATANEEMGKAHLLVDAARLDFMQHADDLRELCKGFYNHLTKYAYARLWKFRPYQLWSFDEQVGGFFNGNRVPILPGSNDPENAEPDMPHSLYFSRDANLYVDFSDYTGDWIKPESRRDEIPDGMDYPWDQAEVHSGEWMHLRDRGALAPIAIKALHEAWSDCRISPKTQGAHIASRQKRTALAVAAVSQLPESEIAISPLCSWPLYCFLRQKPSV